jgi:hypothetical protein
MLRRNGSESSELLAGGLGRHQPAQRRRPNFPVMRVICGAFAVIRNGTVFFVSAGRTLIVTADHVFNAYLKARNRFGHFVSCQLGNLRVHQRA